MSKIISLVIAFGYLITAYILRKDEYLMFLLIVLLLFPLYLIWFGQDRDVFIGSWGRGIDETTEDMVKLAGWLLLLMPIIAYVIVLLTR